MLHVARSAFKSSTVATAARFLTTNTCNSKIPFWEDPEPTTDNHRDAPTTDRYDALVHSAGRSRDFESLYSLLNARVKQKCFNSASTFRFVTNAEPDLASLLDDLNRTLARLDKGFTRKSAYDSLIIRLGKLGQVREAMKLADAMVAGDYGADSRSYYPILRALVKKKMMKEAWDVMDGMRRNRISPDLMSYNEFLTAYCYIGDLNSAVDVLRKIDDAGFQADARTYDAMVLGACKTGKVESALRVIRRMIDDGVSPLYSTYGHIICGMLRLGFYQQAVDFVVSCGGVDTSLDTESFGILAARLIRSKRVEEANFVLKEMNRRGLAMGEKLRDYYKINVA
uniref:PROP1-like PPR domain-containing protein n=1 Tax=Kalanchoe fedtschenkoi TaxID=63787 RepID=A0A7N0ZUP2_KALFE